MPCCRHVPLLASLGHDQEFVHAFDHEPGSEQEEELPRDGEFTNVDLLVVHQQGGRFYHLAVNLFLDLGIVSLLGELFQSLPRGVVLCRLGDLAYQRLDLGQNPSRLAES